LCQKSSYEQIIYLVALNSNIIVELSQMEKIKKLITLILLIVITLASSWSLLQPDFFSVHDFTQGARIVSMSRGIIDGHIPVRWSADFGYGYGMPLFQFYAPLPYYIGSIFYLLGISLVNSIKALMLLLTILTVVGGYKLGKIFFGRSGALITAAALTLAPYRAVNLFVRGAISEAFAIMTLPFILYGVVKVIRKENCGWPILTISLTALFLTHNLTAMMFMPVSIVFGLIYLVYHYREFIKDRATLIHKSAISLLQLGLAYLTSFLIASFYLIPMFFEKHHTKVDQIILGGYFDFRLHFLYIRQFFEENWGYGGSTFGPEDDMSFYLGGGQLIALGFLIFMIARHIFNNRTVNFKNYFMTVVAGIFLLFSLFMTTFRSLLVWEWFEAFSYIQFPWRWLSLAIVFLALMVGVLPTLIKNKVLRYSYTIFLVFLIVFTNYQLFAPERFLSDTSQLYYQDRSKIRVEMSPVLPDYIPADMDVGAFISNQKFVMNEAMTAGLDDVLFCQLDNSCGFDFQISKNLTHQRGVSLNRDTVRDIIAQGVSMELEFNIANYPGWVVVVETGGVEAQEVETQEIETKSSPRGLLTVTLDEEIINNAGDSIEIQAIFKNSQIRNIADTLSVIGLLLFIGYLGFAHKINKRWQKNFWGLGYKVNKKINNK
jgi:hypothetical protein